MYATKRSRSGVYGSQKKQVVKTLSRTLSWTKLMVGTTNKSMSAMYGYDCAELLTRPGVEPKHHFGTVSQWLRGQSWVQTGERSPKDAPSN